MPKSMPTPKLAKVLYSEELGIRLNTKRESELFKWFLAAFLFGKRINESIAKSTWLCFKKSKILSPKEILKAGWHKLVEILDEGGYVRYDFSTADRLLEISKTLLERYGNKPLTRMYREARDSKDLEKKLLELRGVGPITANIFLRELRHILPKANPEPLPIVKKLAKKYHVKLPKNRQTRAFVELEAALIRLRKDKNKK
ncbi:MAG: hypothetical protein QW199_00290 [Candidatus Pacearchaeota archaeon]